MRVAIIPTGRMEWYGLGQALERLFPEHIFYSLPTAREVASNRDIEFPIPSFTSGDVKRVMNRPNNADKLVQRAAAEALGDRRREPADLVVIVDDVELDNIEQPDQVVLAMRCAVQRHLQTIQRRGSRVHERTAQALRERVSFHLAKPMIESWLFADPRGPVHAGVPGDRNARLCAGVDPEDFQTDDPDFDKDDGVGCTCWSSLPERSPKQKKAKRKHKPQWLKAGQLRQRHPKAYMCWLCREATEKNCTTYKETSGGANALAALDWNELLKEPDQARFARALVEDIAWVLGAASPFPGEVAEETSHALTTTDRMLRNL